MKLLLLNSTANTGSTGRIAEEIGLLAQDSGYNVCFAYGRTVVNSSLPLIKIGSKLDINWHGFESRIFDNHGFASRNDTLKLIQKLEFWKPDIINLHNLHGYYLNVKIFFTYLKESQIPIVWTLHDCWPFTGHCTHFEGVGCYKWKTECNKCPNIKGYPSSWKIDNSKRNFNLKKELFDGLKNLTIVTPSQWLANNVKFSFLRDYSLKVINNGTNIEIFKPFPVSGDSLLKKYSLSHKPMILGVASTWKKRKALEDFIKLSNYLGSDYQIVLVGLTKKESSNLPQHIIPIARTESQRELAALYSASSVFVNPTYVDNFPTTNIEALACGTPVITYNTGGSPEAIDAQTGIVVEKSNIDQLKSSIELILSKGKQSYSNNCRQRAELLYNKSDRFKDYVDLFNKMLL